MIKNLIFLDFFYFVAFENIFNVTAPKFRTSEKKVIRIIFCPGPLKTYHCRMIISASPKKPSCPPPRHATAYTPKEPMIFFIFLENVFHTFPRRLTTESWTRINR